MSFYAAFFPHSNIKVSVRYFFYVNLSVWLVRLLLSRWTMTCVVWYIGTR